MASHYDFGNLHISDADLEHIENEMQEIIAENYRSTREELSFQGRGSEAFSSNKYKCELINGFQAAEPLTGYRQGEFFDLCRGPHLFSLGKIKALKVLKTSGAYWRGDSKNGPLTRIYAITFPDRKMLKEHLEMIEEAKKRDHKILGPKLDLFSLKEEAPGMPFIHPKGFYIWNQLTTYIRECLDRCNYIEIKTPTLMTRELWERSGHWANYRQNMFTSHVEERDFAIKPMNCPGCMLFYKSGVHSYRELPLRVAEIGNVHRFEPSGAISGLFRVRSFHQDDAHIFMEPSQIQGEILAIFETLPIASTPHLACRALAGRRQPREPPAARARLEQLGHTVTFAENGREALDVLRQRRVDLVLLDIEMPEMDGYQVLEVLASDSRLRDVPVVMMSSVEEVDSVARCIEMGAEDYLFKPVNPVLLKARVRASLEKKRLRDQQRDLFRKFATTEVAEELLTTGLALGGKHVEASVMFSDIRSFTSITEALSPADTIELLNSYYTLMFDAIGGHGGIVNQMLGDGLMAIFGAPLPRVDHRECAVRAALEMLELVEGFNREQALRGAVEIRIGIGIASGPLVAGFTGTRQRVTYTCVGDTVNLAAHLEAHTKVVGQPILIDESTRTGLGDAIRVESHGPAQFKTRSQAAQVYSVPVPQRP